jgi:hypothetical protein
MCISDSISESCAIYNKIQNGINKFCNKGLAWYYEEYHSISSPSQLESDMEYFRSLSFSDIALCFSEPLCQENKKSECIILDKNVHFRIKKQQT